MRFTPADVKFMQGMIHHHAQAIDMTELLATRTRSDDMKKLALRIQVSQNDEIKMMQRWLEVARPGSAGPARMHMPDACPVDAADDARHAQRRGDGAARRR